MLLILAACAALTQPRPPAFDAASIKLASDESMNMPGRRIQTSPGSLVTHALTLRACMIWAFDEPAQIIGPPCWPTAWD